MYRYRLISYVAASLTILASSLTSLQAATDVTPEEARAIAKDAYIYGFPMVMGYKTMYTYAVDKKSPEYKGPFNHVSCEAQVYTPDDKAIVTPNSDTPYCFVWTDLRQEPLVLTVPKLEAERYYSWQFIDLYTHNFAYVGTLTTGNGANKYLIAGPNWKGKRPAGINKVITSETDFILAVARTQLFGSDDLSQVKKLQSAYKLEPLSVTQGQQASQTPTLPKFPKWVEGAQFDERFFSYFDFMLSLIYTVDEEKPLMDRFGKIGLGTGKSFDMSQLPPDIQKALKQGVMSGFKLMEEYLKEHSGPLGSAKIFGTRDFLKSSASKNFGLDTPYLIRAVAAHIGLYGNSATETIYPAYFADSEGKPLDAAQRQYSFTFKKDQLPPVNAFWSLTMYDAKTQLLVSNPLDRYLLNSTMMERFVYGDDGSLTLYVQAESPGPELEPNWLPAPAGPFYAVLRLYGPEEAALQGEWSPPPLERRE